MDKMAIAGTNRVAMWGSDAMADVIRALDIPYMTLNPGASFRGLHDSVVNYLGNSAPQLLLCLHEEAAVSVAHGYAKVTGRPLAVALHSNVGLMHGSMGIFNAWCDRMPMLVIGATGPFDAAARRPWIDWLHTAQDQGALIRDFIKWDDQPHSVTAARWSLLEGYRRATTAPCGPVYVNLDAALQEDALEPDECALPDAARFAAPAVPAPNSDALSAAADLLRDASAPLILIGRVDRTDAQWQARVRLAERLGAKVLTDFKTGSTFPSHHPLNAAPSGYFVAPQGLAAIRAADVILALDWVDLGGTLRAAAGGDGIAARVINVSADAQLHRGWGKEGGSPPPVDVALTNAPGAVVEPLLAVLGAADPAVTGSGETDVAAPDPLGVEDGEIMSAQGLALVLRYGLAGRRTTLIRAPLSWTGADWPVAEPMDFLGYDGGGGVGSGPGMAVGAALAIRDHHPDRLPVAVLGDGDFLMNASAVWTGASAGVPVLIIVANNRSFYNDEVHQEKVALHRGRPPENKGIGLETDSPAIDIAQIARGHGATGIGPVRSAGAFADALRSGLEAVARGEVVVIDAHIAKGYAPAMANAMRG